jgi:lysophospholipase L1-like esterase
LARHLVIPAEAGVQGIPGSRPAPGQATTEVNSALAAHYGSGQVPYMTYQDISPAFLKSGVLDTSLFSDPQQVPPEPALHPSPEGQARMAAALEPTLSDLLGNARHDR